MNLTDYLELEDVGQSLADLQTPVPIIDVDIVQRNVQRWQKRCDDLGIANRPHIKTHKIAGLARYQIACGAKGVTVQKLGEAEVMADAGITDLLLTFNIIGAPKLKRLVPLLRRTQLYLVADHDGMLSGLSWAALQAKRQLEVLVECDVGAGRNGVQSPDEAAALAKKIESTPGLKFGGLMTYPAAGQRVKTQSFLTQSVALCEAEGIKVLRVTSGGSPDMWSDDGLNGITEYRAGTYIYFDRSLTARGTCSFDDCALSVLTTVVSHPTETRAIVDAGTKALTSDLLGLQGYGIVRELGDAPIYAANEEHGFLDVTQSPIKPVVGDLLRIIPNHVCPVSNLFDHVVFVRGGKILGSSRVNARGLVQ